MKKKRIQMKKKRESLGEEREMREREMREREKKESLVVSIA